MPASAANLSLHDLVPAAADFVADVVHGLSRPQKQLPPKYFYDERGSALFEAICELPEYYLTRVETELTRRHAREFAELLGPRCALIEFGSGASRKTRILLAGIDAAAYVPIDISRAQLEQCALALAQEFPRLKVIAVCADYMRPLPPALLGAASARRRVVYFPGSTIGNFTPREALEFLRNARALVDAGGGLLIGADLKKDAALLNAAYADARGVTARFNLNLLERINREAAADFDLGAFRHRAYYDAARGRVEMHLVSTRAQSVTVHGRRFDFREGESIHTENSYKFSIEEFQALAANAGFTPVKCWTDDARLFSIHYMRC